MTVRGKRILIIDDSLTFRGELADALSEDGYEVTSASSGEEGLARLAEASFDGIFLDMIMPGLSGEQVVKRVKRDPELRRIPVLMLTSREGVEPMLEALRAGADDFVSKSDDLLILKARLSAQLRRVEMEQENAAMREALHGAKLEAESAKMHRELAETRALALAALEEKNRELESARNAAESALKLRDEFLVVASHELRTPLSALLLHLEGTRRLLTDRPDGERVPQKVAAACRQATRLAELVETLLDVARLQPTGVELRREELDLAALASRAVEHLRPQAAGRGSSLELNLDAGVIGRWDGGRIEQVIVNLVTNAIRYGEGAPIEVSVTKDATKAKLVVRDRGIGIEDRDLGRIFGKFERAVPTSKYGGFGLGLYMAREIAEAHGGAIHARSEPGKGSIFVLELPLEPPGRPVSSAGELM